MDYIEIMLRGYTNENDRNFLGKYFIREFKKAENKHYDLEEFFTGLLKGIDTLKNEYQKELFKRKNELHLMLSGAENGTLKYGDLKSESVEERHKKTIEYCKNELYSIGLGYSTINLLHFTNGRFIGHLHYSEVEFIGNGIAKAYKVLNEPQQTETVIPDEVKKEFKDFFNTDVNVNVIQSIQKEFKDYKGKKMAHLIYLLHKDFKIINYSLNSRNESRKHFVSLLKGTDFRMAGIDNYFELSDVKLENPKFEIDPDYIDIKEKLLKTIK